VSSPAPEIVPDGKVFTVASELLTCLCTELARSVGGPPCECALMPGVDVPMDFCDCSGTACGMGWVNVAAVFPTTSFPLPAAGAIACGTPMAARYRIGTHRCMPVMTEDGEPPSAVDRLEATRVALSDEAAVRRAICCAVDKLKLSKAHALGLWTPTGPAGQCGGGFWTLTVRVT
jgi:hypothetical protein